MNSSEAARIRWSVLLLLNILIIVFSGRALGAYDGSPIIFIPGTAGIWNEEQYRVLLNDSLLFKAVDRATANYTTVVNGELFILEPFGGLYNDFFEFLEGRGLIRDKDYFIFGYDTITTSIEVNARRLSDYIEYVRQRTRKYTVRIVAHSQGGLVARACIQFETDPDRIGSVSELVMVATPNKGTLLTYQMIEGGDCHTYQNYLSVQAPFEILVSSIVKGSFIKGYAGEVVKKLNTRGADGEYLYQPIWQMLPTFPYLIDSRGMRLDIMSPEAYPINLLLHRLNGSSLARLSNIRVIAVISIGTPIPETFIVDAADLNRTPWPHGKILSEGFGSGDGVCLVKSTDLSSELSGSDYKLIYTRDADGQIASVDHNHYFTSKNLTTWISCLALPQP